VIYQIEDDTVRILRILHSAREWSEDLIDER
jgi:plasmid stabilization system protein ParE